MKITKLSDVVGSNKDVQFNGGRSLRIITKEDEMGFGFNKTYVKEGGPYHWHYKNHLESCYCISGHGLLVNVETGERHEILPDTTYLLDKNDNHLFTALQDTILISVFNPPLRGDETHQSDGSYR